MAAIDIPDAYWDVQPAGFSALAQEFERAATDVHRDVVDALNAHNATAGGELPRLLVDLDGDADLIERDMGDEHASIAATPTGDVLGFYIGADGLTRAADGQNPTYTLLPPNPLGPPPNIPEPIDGEHPPRRPGDDTNPPPRRPPRDDGGQQPQTPTEPGTTEPPPETPEPPPPPPPDETIEIPPPPERGEGDDRGHIVTRGELADLLAALDFTINLQV